MMETMTSERKEKKDRTFVDTAPRHSRNAARAIVHFESSVEACTVDVCVRDEQNIKPSAFHNPWKQEQNH